jgi:hypothetical protein
MRGSIKGCYLAVFADLNLSFEVQSSSGQLNKLMQYLELDTTTIVWYELQETEIDVRWCYWRACGVEQYLIHSSMRVT